MFNWQPFTFSQWPNLNQQIQYYIIPNVFIPKERFITEQNLEKNIQPENFIVQNYEKLQLTEDDLKQQPYQNNKNAWTEQEDKKLLYLYERKKLSWEQIAQKIPQRNKKMCYSRYRRLQSGTKIQWTKSDNEKLTSLVQQYGQDWKQLVNFFKNRNAKQLKQHYKNYARPNIIKTEWCLEDDLTLINLVNKYGKNWKVIENQMSHRSLNQIKNRFFGKLKKLNTALYGQKFDQ